MRIWHLILAVVVVALGATACRDAVGRVALVVFLAGLGEFVIGLFAVMGLFRTVGALGHAREPVAYAEALAATILILLVASATMVGLGWVAVDLLQAAVD